VSSTTKGMDVKIYPNPYTDNFNVSLSTSNDNKVAIAVYDMIGRLIETRDVNPRESSDVRIGDKYPSGVYNVVVTQGEEVKTLKVIKR
jgi:putative heme degradation protein